jgi:hypothetical protein
MGRRAPHPRRHGALFGLAFDAVSERTRLEPRRLALTMALAEGVASWPLTVLVDRFHPARGESGIPALLTNGRAFAQAVLRHALFGLVLGRLSRPA